ncbi:hypothetical protein LZ31DRAFT_254665 [Colletotrichum somersetense]|nr:hypothetical protein LZ31DRAFT_254665 [Colletotrichum somersetense]
MFKPNEPTGLTIHIALVVWSDLLPAPFQTNRPSELYSGLQNEGYPMMNELCGRLFECYPSFERPSYRAHKPFTFSPERRGGSSPIITTNDNNEEIPDIQSPTLDRGSFRSEYVTGSCDVLGIPGVKVVLPERPRAILPSITSERCNGEFPRFIHRRPEEFRNHCQIYRHSTAVTVIRDHATANCRAINVCV